MCLNKNLAINLLPFIQAWVDGKIVQWRYTDSDEWFTLKDNGIFEIKADTEWRIKPNPRKFWVVTTKHAGNVAFTTLESATNVAEANNGTIIPVIEILD